MTKAGYLSDILARSFFLFVALHLLLRNFVFSLFLAVSLNLIYELTVGRKFWITWKNTPRQPRRNWRIVLRDLWHRTFSRERTKGFVWAGILLLLMSYVVRLKVYYVVVACLVFTLAAITRFAPPVKSATIPHNESAHDETVRSPSCPPTPTE